MSYLYRIHKALEENGASPLPPPPRDGGRFPEQALDVVRAYAAAAKERILIECKYPLNSDAELLEALDREIKGTWDSAAAPRVYKAQYALACAQCVNTLLDASDVALAARLAARITGVDCVPQLRELYDLLEGLDDLVPATTEDGSGDCATPRERLSQTEGRGKNSRTA